MIDIRTLLLALAIGNIGLGVLMAGYADGQACNPAMRAWAAARLLKGSAHLVAWLRPEIEWGGVPLMGYALLIGGTAIELVAYCIFLGLPAWRTRLCSCTVLALAAIGLMFAVQLPPAQLLRLVAAEVGAFSLVMAALLLRDWGRVSVMQRWIGLNNAVFAVVLAAHAVHGISAPHLYLLAGGVVLNATFAVGYLMMIVNGFGFLLLCKQKDDARMVRLATIDCLTGLFNRQAFFERAERARAARRGRPLALLMIDIDHFKKINDCHGHAIGDQALALFAATARTTLRDDDILGRLGDEEFALVLPATDLDGAMLAAERLRTSVAASSLVTASGAYSMTISIGVVAIDCAEAINTALARADQALYASKRGGRNRVSVGE